MDASGEYCETLEPEPEKPEEPEEEADAAIYTPTVDEMC